MEFLRPTTLAEALALKSERPDAVPIAGGTDVMVELNFDHRRPEALLDLTRVPELAEWSTSDGTVRLGAGVPYSRVIAEVGESVPALAMASRTVGSPQIRNRGTVGGNLGAASPAGDTHPVLLALDAQVEVASVRGSRTLRAEEFYVGVKRHALEPDELITAVHLPAHAGPQQFAKVGTRNAMVIAVCSFALALRDGVAGAAIGSAAPTPRRAREAEEFLDRGAAVGLVGAAAGLPEAPLRRAGGRSGFADRRRPRQRRVPQARAGGARAAYVDLGLGRTPDGGARMRLNVTINGEERQADDVWEGESLLYVLRERLGLPGLEERL